MPALTPDAFRDAVRTAFQQPATTADRDGLAARLDAALRLQVAAVWRTVRLLEARVRGPLTGNPDALREMLRGEFDNLVEAWQQAVLARPRATLSAADAGFRTTVVGRYDGPAGPTTAADLGAVLDADLEPLATSFVAMCDQLFLIAAELAKGPDLDVGEQAKIDLREVLALWKRGVLARPRAHAGAPRRNDPTP